MSGRKSLNNDDTDQNYSKPANRKSSNNNYTDLTGETSGNSNNYDYHGKNNEQYRKSLRSGRKYYNDD